MEPNVWTWSWKPPPRRSESSASGTVGVLCYSRIVVDRVGIETGLFMSQSGLESPLGLTSVGEQSPRV